MKQYLAQFQLKMNAEKNEWANASIATGGSRYLKTKEEAEQALQKALKHFNRGARTEQISIGGLGFQTVVDEATAERMQIVKTRIKVREVSEWEEI